MIFQDYKMAEFQQGFGALDSRELFRPVQTDAPHEVELAQPYSVFLQ